MYSKNITRAVAALLGMGVVAAFMHCAYERNNPVDSGADNFVGERYVNDHGAPVLVVTFPAADTVLVDRDSVLISGMAWDMESGIASVQVNQTTAFIDSVIVESGVRRVYWRSTLYLSADTTLLQAIATDSSFHRNQTTRTRTALRMRHPRAPSQVRAHMMGPAVRVSWRDESQNESGFVVERRSGASLYDSIGLTGADDTVFVDDVGPFVVGTAYYYRVIAFNEMGASPPSQAAVVVYDLAANDVTPPDIEFIAPGDGDTLNQSLITVWLSVQDGSGVRDSSVRVNGIAAQRDGSHFRCEVPLAQGETTVLQARAADNSPNENYGEAAISVFCDTSALDTRGPQINFVQPPNGATVGTAAITVTLTATDASGVSGVTLSGVTMDASSGNVYTLSGVALAAGENVLPVAAQDELGNVSHDTLRITYDAAALDTLAPVLSILAPQNNVTLSSATIVVSGTVYDDSDILSVMVNGVSAELNLPGWDATCMLAHGRNVIIVEATDNSPAQNKAVDSVVVVLNNQPLFVGSKPPSIDTFYIGSGEYSMTVHAEDPDGDSVLYALAEPSTGAAMTPSTDGLGVTVTYEPQTQQTVLFRVRAFDEFGGESSISWSVVFLYPPQTPYFTAEPNDTTIDVGVTYSATVAAADPVDNARLQNFILVTYPSTMSISQESKTRAHVHWTPAQTDTGLHVVRIDVSNNTGSTVTTSWRLTVRGGAGMTQWVKVNAAPLPDGLQTSLSIDHQGVALAGQMYNNGGLYSFKNNSWEKVSEAPFTSVNSVVALSTADAVYVAGLQDSYSRVMYNSGGSWNTIGSFAVLDLVLVPSSNTCYAVRSGTSEVFSSENGASFQSLGNISSNPITALAYGNGSNSLYAADRNHRVLRDFNRAHSWQVIGGNLPDTALCLAVVSGSDESVLIGFSNHGLHVGRASTSWSFQPAEHGFPSAGRCYKLVSAGNNAVIAAHYGTLGYQTWIRVGDSDWQQMAGAEAAPVRCFAWDPLSGRVYAIFANREMYYIGP